jgi:hypothetical protein
MILENILHLLFYRIPDGKKSENLDRIVSYSFIGSIELDWLAHL